MPVRLVQITDTHLFADVENSLLGVKTEESFRALLTHIKRTEVDPDLILLSGDLTQDGSKAAYTRLAKEISQLGVPVYCTPGNHDDSDVMQEIFPLELLSIQKQVVINNDWQLILLDSHIQGKVEGHLKPQELNFLKECLQSHPTHRAIIAFHHQPIPVGSAWLDPLGINNANELWDILKFYPQTHTVLFGHVHQEMEGIKNTIHYYSTPSTCIQFKGNCNHFTLEKLGPAYRIIDLYPNKILKTHVQRLEGYIGKFEANAKGY